MLNCFTGSHFGRVFQSRIPEYVKVIYNSFKSSLLGFLLALGNMNTLHQHLKNLVGPLLKDNFEPESQLWCSTLPIWKTVNSLASAYRYNTRQNDELDVLFVKVHRVSYDATFKTHKALSSNTRNPTSLQSDLKRRLKWKGGMSW